MAHVIAIARVSLTIARAHAENHFDARVRLKAANDRLRQEAALLCEELRIKDARMDRIPVRRRPHYPPIDRLSILELRAARGWTGAETVRRLLVTPMTVIHGNQHLHEEGADPLIQFRDPVSWFPDFVGYLDLTAVPTSAGLWTSWAPCAFAQSRPFCRWVAVVVDHYSRRVMGAAVFPAEPSALDVIRIVCRVCRRAECRPKHLITDHGAQFSADGSLRGVGTEGFDGASVPLGSTAASPSSSGSFGR